MLARQDMHREITGQGNSRIPVFLVDAGHVESPLLKILADAQGTDDVLRLVLQCHDAGIIEMIPMVVGKNQHVHRRNVGSCIDIAAVEGPVDEKGRRSIAAEHRVDKDAIAAEVQVQRRVAHPDDTVLVKRQGMQVRFLGNHPSFRL